jgi:4-alpha-glucanotransferase
MMPGELMRFAPLDHYFTGVSVPVAALRTQEDCGVGEFADLPRLAAWCAGAGLEVIQVLPVNDTGANSSPYSALSAFALHPLYLRLQDLPGAGQHAAEMEAFRERARSREAGSGGRFSHGEVLSFKLDLAERLFQEAGKAAAGHPSFTRWLAANPWVRPYAVFTALKRERAGTPWASWGEMANPSEADILRWWEDHPEQCLCVAWIQHQLEQQLSRASHLAQEKGVHLKGDVPILMSRESVDVWACRSYFEMDANAGAPPDMFSPNGQNWGFPVYNWEALGADGYRWWKDRLTQAGKFFHALRIDHVLGFFRIWSIPRQEATGLLGRFSPSAGVAAQELLALGFDDGRLRWLTLPHVTGQELAAALGNDASRVAQAYLTRIGAEEMYNIRQSVDSEAAIQALQEPQAVRDFLLSRHADRALLPDGNGIRYPSWYIDGTRAFRSLSDGERSGLRDLLSRKRAESERIWEQRGRTLLSMLRDTTDMLVCAEDLGDVPDCVPKVLAELGILGLRIIRWSREYKKAAPGEPAAFIPPASYPWLSVCTPSVHDTSTIRGWWEEDADEREAYFRSMEATGPCPRTMTPDLQARIFTHCLGAGSLLCMFQIQDILDLDSEIWSPDPRGDRINVPGTVNDQNWTWRLPLGMEELEKRTNPAERVRALTAPRRARRPDAPGNPTGGDH